MEHLIVDLVGITIKHEDPHRLASRASTDNSARKLTIDDLYKVANSLGQNWRQFGRQILGFQDSDLDNVELNYGRNGYPEIPYQMLRKWNNAVGGSATVSRLINLITDREFAHIISIIDH